MLSAGVRRAALSVSGARKVAVVLLKMSDSTTSTKPDDVRAAIFTRHSAFLKEVSLGYVTLVGKNSQAGDVYGPFAIASASTPCDYARWTTEGGAAARAAGIDLSGYDHVMYHADKASCSWAGIASHPGSWLMIKAGHITNDAVTGHEFGHNFGLHHGNTYSCKDAMGARVTLSDTCTSTEYGDPFELMGSVVRRHFNASSKAFLGWLPSYSVTQSGRYFLTFQEQRYSMPQALSIVRTRLPSGAPQDYFALEVRQAFGIDDFAAGSPVLSGVSVRLIKPLTYAQRDHTHINYPHGYRCGTSANLQGGNTSHERIFFHRD